jgi:beta-ureidopropionase / N-carbamoyl-L-amino-acid hydrolase
MDSGLVQALQINGDRLNQQIQDLAKIGQLPNGGVSRVAFTPEDLQARELVQKWMVDAGMAVRVDAAGNLIGRYAGKDERAKAIVTGSHIDTVAVGGIYDGCLGVLAGIEVVRTLRERSLRLNHPVEVVVFTDEERTMIGCKAMAGELTEASDYYDHPDGTPIQDCLATIGGNWEQIGTAKREDIQAYVELHVEQGGVLEQREVEIGVVTGIVGQYRCAVKVHGQPNHAGATPMEGRQDALVAAAQVVLKVNQIATAKPGDQVGTVGYLYVLPNATNIVPGEVDLRIDMRDLDEMNLEMMVMQLKEALTEIAVHTRTEITIEPILQIRPTLANPAIMTEITQACQVQGLTYCELPSRAGHDAQAIGRVVPMGMIFVPSRGGISHSQDEFTSIESCVQGANVLLQTIIALADI